MPPIKAPWDEFPGLWNQPATDPMFENMRKQQAIQTQQAYARRSDFEIEQEIKQQAMRDAIAAATKGMNFEQALPTMKDAMMQYGDIKGALGVDAVEQSRSNKGQLEESRQLESIKAIAPYDPNMAQQMYQGWGLEDKFGPVDFSAFQKGKVHFGERGEIAVVNDDGSYKITRHARPEKDSEQKFKPMQYVDQEGNYHQVNNADPEAVAEAEAMGWHRPTQSDGFLSLQRDLDKKKADSGGGMWQDLKDTIFGAEKMVSKKSDETPPAPPPGYKIVGKNEKTGKWQIAPNAGM